MKKLKLGISILFIFLSNISFADDIGMMFFPNSSNRCESIASLNDNNLTTPSTKANTSCFNNVFDEARKGFSGTIDAQLDDGKAYRIWDTKFVARYVKVGEKYVRILAEVKDGGKLGLFWLDPSSKESKTNQKIDVHEDNIE